MAGLSTAAKIMKFVIVACNILSFLIGLTAVVLGITDLVYFDSPLETEIVTVSNILAAGAIMLGLFIIVVAFLGLCGALRTNANVLIAIYNTVKEAVRAVVKDGKPRHGSSEKWTAIINWMETTFDCTTERKSTKSQGRRDNGSGKKDCAEVIADAVQAELVTIGGCLLGITLLSFFASAIAFLLARNIKVYVKV